MLGSPLGLLAHGSNGIVERAVQTVEGQIRVMKLALEGRLGHRVDAEANVVTFVVEYASYLINRLEVGRDGKTAYERTKGKSASVLGLEFGEKLLWRKKAQAKLDKINSRWDFGIFAGVRARSGEFWVATKNGVFKARAVRRIPAGDQWSYDTVSWVKNVPWNLYANHAEADGDIPEDKAVDVETEAGPERNGQAVPPVIVKTRQVAPRAFQIRKDDAEKFGYTKGCAGCSSWFRGLGRQPHSDECRNRFAKVMKEDAKYKNAAKRKQEFEDRMKEKHARRETKKRGMNTVLQPNSQEGVADDKQDVSGDQESGSGEAVGPAADGGGAGVG